MNVNVKIFDLNMAVMRSLKLDDCDNIEPQRDHMKIFDLNMAVQEDQHLSLCPPRPKDPERCT